MRKFTTLLLLSLVPAALAFATLADDEAPKAPEPGTLVIVDSAGKELKVKSYKFTGGVRQLSWLAPASKEDSKDEKKDKTSKGKKAEAASGPDALILYEELKAVYMPGVQTLVPLDRIRSISFAKDKETMTVRAATSAKADDDATLVGTTAYRRINTVSVEADVDKGKSGVASLTFQSSGKRPIKAIRFPTPKVQAEKAGRSAVVVALNGKTKRTHKVSDLTPLYAFRGGRQKTSGVLLFRKTLRLDVSNIKKIVASAEDSNDTVWQVVQKDGDDSTLTLMESGTVDGAKAQLVGLVGKVPAGYKLFPIIAIHSITFDATEEPKDKDKDKDDKDKDKKDKEKKKDEDDQR